MKADSDEAEPWTWISMLKKLFITTHDPTSEGDDNTSPDTAVPRISQEQPHNRKRPLPRPCVGRVKKRQRRDNPSRSKDARLTKKRGQRCLRDHVSSPLLWLPVELRLVIFRMVLGDRKIHVHYKRGLHSDPNNLREQMAFTQYLPQYYESFEHRLSIFAVSRQMCEEALEVYYGTNIFSFATASFFNIFISRLTKTKASMLRKVEFLYDRGDFYTLEDKKSTRPPRWSLGVQNTDILEKVANIADITIRYCNLYLVTRRKVWKDSKVLESTQLNERLRRDFGGLCKLKGITRVNVRVYDDYTKIDTCLGIPKPLLDKACLDDIGHKFAREILGGGELRV